MFASGYDYSIFAVSFYGSVREEVQFPRACLQEADVVLCVDAEGYVRQIVGVKRWTKCRPAIVRKRDALLKSCRQSNSQKSVF